MDAPAGDIQLGVLKILKKTKKALRLFWYFILMDSVTLLSSYQIFTQLLMYNEQLPSSSLIQVAFLNIPGD
jgi:hypothetical protein